MAENRFGGIPVVAQSSGNRFGGIPVTSQPDQEPVAEYEGFFQEIFEGLGAGAVGIFQGVGETVGAGVDLATGLAGVETNLSQGATDIGEAVKDYAGLDPSGFVGEGVEVLTQFVAPGLGAFMLANKLMKAKRLAKDLYEGNKKLSNAEKTARAATAAAAYGSIDAVVATDGMTTVSDFFDGGGSITGLGDTLG